MACFDNETATAYLRGDLEPEDAERWAAHVTECDACRRVVQEVSALIDSVREDLTRADADLPAVDSRCAERRIQKRVGGTARVLRLKWPSPRLVRVTLAAAAVMLLFVVFPREAPVSAAEVLRRATIAEQATEANVTAVVHRTLTIEERQTKAGVVRRQRVEIWHSAVERTKVRRLYDERGQLVAGEWTRGDGSRSLYYPKKAPVIERADTPVPLDSENAWRWEPSAQSFTQTTGPGILSLDRTGDDGFVLSANARAPNAAGIVSAKLVLTARDFRPVAQTFVVDRGADTREFTLTEYRFETFAPDRVEAARFVPEAELIPMEVPAPIPIPPRRPVASVPAAPTLGVDPARLDRLEMQAWYRLHGLRLRLGSDAYVHRTSAKVYVDVTVSNDLKRTAVIHRLESIAVDGALQAEVRVSSEGPDAGGIPIQEWPGNPIYELLRRQALTTLRGSLEPAAASAAADIVARETAQGLLNESNLIQTRVQAMSRFSEAWPTERLRHLDLDSLAAWQTVIRDHAIEAGQRAESLIERMEPFLGRIPETSPAKASERLNGPRDVERLVERFSRLASRQRDILTEALPTAFAGSRDHSLEPSFGELREVLTEIAAIAETFAGPWPLER